MKLSVVFALALLTVGVLATDDRELLSNNAERWSDSDSDDEGRRENHFLRASDWGPPRGYSMKGPKSMFSFVGR